MLVEFCTLFKITMCSKKEKRIRTELCLFLTLSTSIPHFFEKFRAFSISKLIAAMSSLSIIPKKETGVAILKKY